MSGLLTAQQLVRRESLLRVNCNTSYDLTSEVAEYHFHNFLLLKQDTPANSVQRERIGSHLSMDGESKDLLPYLICHRSLNY